MFVNDTDYEMEIDEDYEDGLIYQGVAEYYKSRDVARAALFEGLAAGVWADLTALNSDMKNANVAFNGGWGAGFGVQYSQGMATVNEPF